MRLEHRRASRAAGTSMDASLGWAGWAVLSAIFAATTAILLKLGLEDIEPVIATVVPTAVLCLVLTGYVTATGSWSGLSHLSKNTWFYLMLTGLSTGVSWLFYARALKVGDASKVVPVDRLSLVIVAVFAMLFLGERPSGRDWLGIVMVALGAMTLALKR
jgi:bacterial/archaeal transporter family protein